MGFDLAFKGLSSWVYPSPVSFKAMVLIWNILPLQFTFHKVV